MQSVAVRLVVEREREIKAFVPEEFWEVDASTTTPSGEALALQVTHQNDKPFRPVNKEQTQAAVSLLEKARYSVLEREDKPTTSKPGAPYYLYAATSCQHPSWFWCEKNHDDGAASV